MAEDRWNEVLIRAYLGLPDSKAGNTPMGDPDISFSLALAARKRRARNRRGNTPGAPLQAGTNTVLSPTQKKGLHWEQCAAELLQNQGMAILARNLKRQTGEIDLVALEPDGTLVFVEVRHRSNARFGRAADTVMRHKQQRLIRTAQLLLPGLCQRFLGGRTPVCRFDIIGFDGSEPVWLRAAFEA